MKPQKSAVPGKRLQIAFFVCFYVLFTLFIGLFARDFRGDQANVFFLKTGNYLADYINVAKYSTTLNPYTDTLNGRGEKAYLPITYMLFRFLGSFADYANQEAFIAGLSPMGLLTANLFLLLSTCFFCLILFTKKRGNSVTKALFIGTVLLSSVFLFSFERGNIIILAAGLVSFFIFNFENEHPVVREISYLCLALAAALKIFPAVFGVLLLYKGKYKDALRLTVYGLIISIVPFGYFEGGYHNIVEWAMNVKASNESYMFRIFPRFGPFYFISYSAPAISFISTYQKTIGNILFLLTYLVSFVGIITAKYLREKWKLIAFLACVVLFLPVNSAFYCGLYLIPALLLFINKKSFSKIDYFYLVLFLLIINPLQVMYKSFSVSLFLCNVSVGLLFVALFVNGLIAAIASTTRCNKQQEIPPAHDPQN